MIQLTEVRLKGDGFLFLNQTHDWFGKFNVEHENNKRIVTLTEQLRHNNSVM